MLTSRFVGWFCDPETSEVTGMAHSGANSVAMGPYCIMANWNDSNAGTLVGTTAQFTAAMRSARQQGLKVVLKPILDCRNYGRDPDTAGWRAAINPANMTLWIEDYYRKCFQPFLDLVDMIAIHTELVTVSSSYPASFIELIQEIRLAGFSGPITTSSDFNPMSSPYWTALDCIGGDAYPTVRSDSTSNAVADWRGLAQQAAVANAQTGCNILFGELCPNDSIAMTAEQTTIVYDAFWEVFGPLDYWAGALAWRWPQNGTTPSAALMSSFTRGLAEHPTYSAPRAAP